MSDIPPTHAFCHSCRKHKPRSHFWRHKGGPGGLQWSCKLCLTEKRHERKIVELEEELHTSRVYNGRLRLEVYDLERLVRKLMEKVYGLRDPYPTRDVAQARADSSGTPVPGRRPKEE